MTTMSEDRDNQLLKDYHAVSILEETHNIPQNDAGMYHMVIQGCRELVSRCIMSNDPRRVIGLFYQLTILLRVLGRYEEVRLLRLIVHNLVRDYEQNHEI